MKHANRIGVDWGDRQSGADYGHSRLAAAPNKIECDRVTRYAVRPVFVKEAMEAMEAMKIRRGAEQTLSL